MSETAYLLQTFKFRVTLTRGRPGADQRDPRRPAPSPSAAGCSWRPTSRSTWRAAATTGSIRRVGRVKLVPLVLKRGMFSAAIDEVADSAIWDWLTAMVTGAEVRRYHGQVELMDPTLRDGRWPPGPSTAACR